MRDLSRFLKQRARPEASLSPSDSLGPVFRLGILARRPRGLNPRTSENFPPTRLGDYEQKEGPRLPQPHSVTGVAQAVRTQDAFAKWLVFERLLCVRLYLGRSRRIASCSAAEAAISSRCSSSVSIQATSKIHGFLR